jgi:hypothetical protein
MSPKRYAGPLRRRPCLGCGSTEHKDCRPPRRSAGIRTGEYRRPEYVKLRAEVQAGKHGPCACAHDGHGHDGRACGATEDLTVGHLKAVIRGGTIEDGWQVQCRHCNSSLKGGLWAS